MWVRIPPISMKSKGIEAYGTMITVVYRNRTYLALLMALSMGVLAPVVARAWRAAAAGIGQSDTGQCLSL